MEKREPSCTVGGKCKLIWPLRKTVWRFLKKTRNKTTIKWKWMKSLSCVRLFVTPWAVACTRLLRPWDFLGKSTGVGCYFLLQGIFPTQGSNPGLLDYRQTLYHLSHQGSPKTTIWPSNPTTRHIPWGNQNWKDTCTPMFTAALFTIARTRKQPRCPSTNEQIKRWGTYIQGNITQP